MTSFAVKTTSFQVENRQWYRGTAADPGRTISGTLDVSAFSSTIHYPNGYIPSGTPLAKITATGLYGPYSVTEEVQTLTEGGSGLTSFTITYSGQTTASITQGATAAAVQAALIALSNLDTGDVVVTGAAGGPYTLTFGGTLADTNVAAVTTTPTGGTGTMVVATTVAGGAEGTGGLETCKGLLFSSTKVPDTSVTTIDVGAGILTAYAPVKYSLLPFTIDANGRADLPLISWEV